MTFAKGFDTITIMTTIEIVLIGMALAMDAAALTIANCTTYKQKLTPLKEWSMPVTFTLFQMLMPIIGFYLGSLVAQYISSVAGYITAGIFFILSLKIIIDNIIEILKAKKAVTTTENTPSNEKKQANFTIWVLLIQAVATSIDALAIGVTLSVTVSSPFIPALIIGGVTLVIATLALLFGKYLGKLFGKYASWVGAIILMALAIKSLVEAIIG